jgi:hypothetical protein
VIFPRPAKLKCVNVEDSSFGIHSYAPLRRWTEKVKLGKERSAYQRRNVAISNVIKVLMKFHVEDSNNNIATVRWSLAWHTRKRFFNLGPVEIARHCGKFVRRAICTTYSHAIIEVLIHITLTPNMTHGQNHFNTDVLS